MKGYVMRGQNPQGVGFFVPCETLDAAIREWAAFVGAGLKCDVRIFAVADDGTETPIPTYEEALAIVDLARRLIRSGILHATAGGLAKLTCNEEPYAALSALFFAEEEAARTIPGLVCTECDRPIYRGSEYAGRTGDAAHKACRNWPKGTTFRKAGDGSRVA